MIKLMRALIPSMFFVALCSVVVGCSPSRESPDRVPPAPEAQTPAKSGKAVASSQPTTNPSAPVPPKKQPPPVLVIENDPAADSGSPDDRQASKEDSVIFGAGCFWCVESVFEELAGVTAAVSGYCGGTADGANYEAVCGGNTGHAEVVKVTFDPSIVSYGQLLQVLFATHDPTTLNRQGPDWGTQYRSAVFYRDEAQRKFAADYIRQLDSGDTFGDPIVTSLEKLEHFYPAEKYHQDFVKLHPDHAYVRAHALPKVAKVRKLFKDLIRH